MATFDEINKLPENKPTLNNLIDQKFVQSTTPDGYEQELINSYNKQFEPKEIGAQGVNALYPGMNQPINVGTYSGSIVGNNPIFVPTGDILARDPILARRKAIDDAARARAADIKPYERSTAPTTVDPYYNKQVYSEFTAAQDDIIKRAQKQYGKDFRIILEDKNTKLGKEMANLSANTNFMVKDIDAITNMISSMDKGLLDKTIHLSKSQRKTYNEYKAKIGNFSDLTSLQEANLPEMHEKMRASIDLNDYFNNSGVMDDLQASVDQTYYTGDKGDYYESATNKKTSYSEIIKDLSKNLAEGTFADEIERGIYTLEDISSGLSARLKDSNERSGNITKKSDKQIAKGEGTQINAWEENRQEYNPEDPKSQILFKYDSEGNRIEGGDYALEVVEDYNMKHDGGVVTKINERLPEGKIQTQDFKGVSISGVEVYWDKGKEKVIPGNSLVSFKTMSRLKNGDIIIMADIAEPTKTKVSEVALTVGDKKDKKPSTFDSYTIKSRAVILRKGNQGTGMVKKIAATIKGKKAKAAFEEYYNNLIEGGKPKESETANYSEREEEGIKSVMDRNGITREEAISELQRRGKLK